MSNQNTLINIDVESIELDTRTVFSASDDIHEKCLRKISGTISAFDDSGDDEFQIGSFRAYFVDINRADNNGLDPRDVLDVASATLPYMDLVDENSLYAPFVEENRVFTFTGNMLIIDRLEILPEYQGQKAGLVALKTLMDSFDGQVNLFALKPFPLQHESKARRIAGEEYNGRIFNPNSFEKDKRKLESVYSKLNFSKLGDEIMVCPAGQPTPSLEELLRPEKKQRRKTSSSDKYKAALAVIDEAMPYNKAKAPSL